MGDLSTRPANTTCDYYKYFLAGELAMPQSRFRQYPGRRRVHARKHTFAAACTHRHYLQKCGCSIQQQLEGTAPPGEYVAGQRVHDTVSSTRVLEKQRAVVFDLVVFVPVHGNDQIQDNNIEE